MKLARLLFFGLIAVIPFLAEAGSTADEIAALLKRVQVEQKRLDLFDKKVSLFLEGRKARDGDGFGSQDSVNRFIELMKGYPGLSASRIKALQLLAEAPEADQESVAALAADVMVQAETRHIQEAVALLAQSAPLKAPAEASRAMRDMALGFLVTNLPLLPDAETMLADLRILWHLAQGGFIPDSVDFENRLKNLRQHCYEAGDALVKDFADELHASAHKNFAELTGPERRALFRLYRRHVQRIVMLRSEFDVLYKHVNDSLKK